LERKLRFAIAKCIHQSINQRFFFFSSCLLISQLTHLQEYLNHEKLVKDNQTPKSMLERRDERRFAEMHESSGKV
jgi:hypothetical protein